MSIGPKLEQKVGVGHSLTQDVQQALKLLHMNNTELTEFVQQELSENPFLQEADPHYLDTPSQPNSSDISVSNSSEDILEKTVEKTDSVFEYLLEQVNLTFSDKTQRYIATLMLGVLDENGYFTAPLKVVAKFTKQSVDAVAAVLSKLQQLDPPGIFARDLSESLWLQAIDKGFDCPKYKGVIDHLEDIANGLGKKIGKKLNISEDEMIDILQKIKGFSPYPLRITHEEIIVPRIPDIFIREKEQGKWMVELNQETLPRILVDTEYYLEIKTHINQVDQKEFLKERYARANWLVKAMDQRQRNILNVCGEIVKRQEAFLLHGPNHMAPMTLKDIATELGIHESTVSRVTSNKYVETPIGVYSLKYFFNSSVSGGLHDHSSEAVRQKIKKMIMEESSPLSDAHIAEQLGYLGIDIARRTVTKYRESMEIPSSAERRKQQKSVLATRTN